MKKNRVKKPNAGLVYYANLCYSISLITSKVDVNFDLIFPDVKKTFQALPELVLLPGKIVAIKIPN